MILIDLNVILDVVQAREPHHRASGALLENVVSAQTQACVPAHAITTLHYLLARYQDAAKANEVVDWVIRRFDSAGAISKTRSLRRRPRPSAALTSLPVTSRTSPSPRWRP